MPCFRKSNFFPCVQGFEEIHQVRSNLLRTLHTGWPFGINHNVPPTGQYLPASPNALANTPLEQISHDRLPKPPAHRDAKSAMIKLVWTKEEQQKLAGPSSASVVNSLVIFGFEESCALRKATVQSVWLLRDQTLAPLVTPTFQNQPAGFRCHSASEPMCLGAFTAVRAIGRQHIVFSSRILQPLLRSAASLLLISVP